MTNGIAHADPNSPIPLVPLFPSPFLGQVPRPSAVCRAARRWRDWTWLVRPMNDIEIRRLAHALNELRPDWPVSSLTTWLSRNMTNRPYRDAAVALVWVAVDTKPDGTHATERPARVLEPGPWWTAAAMNGTAMAGRPQPIRREEQCQRCGGQLPNCACRLEHLAATYDDDETEGERMDRETAMQAARAALVAAKGNDEEGL